MQSYLEVCIIFYQTIPELVDCIFHLYDAIQEMRLFGDISMNQRNEHGEKKHYRFHPNIGTELYNEQKRINYLVRECVAQKGNEFVKK